MEVQRARIAAIAGLCGATVAQDKAYPGWAPNPSSPVLQVLHAGFMLGLEALILTDTDQILNHTFSSANKSSSISS